MSGTLKYHTVVVVNWVMRSQSYWIWCPQVNVLWWSADYAGCTVHTYMVLYAMYPKIPYCGGGELCDEVTNILDVVAAAEASW